MRLQLICMMFIGTVIAIPYGAQEVRCEAVYNFDNAYTDVRICTNKKGDGNCPYTFLNRCAEEDVAV
ncbi:hypothetical protein N7491_002907 [Penicillium cf. griseofulvum]|uniref:Secreted protein n=1 Tax=Penicillium cf. griseofulvum TaxID=2972120 RepID=A0A9W9T210_9EURO|nr:hypothetical protein N7472_002925 [Penicillium cf. griseofulvum]KAJ5440501.1 hypothetical protein N7491_002907 [Penicillium cf. griseofulvum]